MEGVVIDIGCMVCMICSTLHYEEGEPPYTSGLSYPHGL